MPLELERVVNRALAKPVADRYQTVADLLSELRTVTRALDSGATAAAGAEKSVPSIAVLPFSDMSPQKDQDYFCEGMAEELINGLSGVEGLRVAARASAFQLKGEPIRKIGELLNVKTVLDGSVRTAGTRLRVTVQLIEAASGYQIWSKRYDRDTGDVFAIQDEISEGIVEALQDSLVDTTKKQGGQPRRSTDSLDAYQMFLKGRHNWYKRETGSLQRAARFFEQAAALDPHFAQAHVGIALTFTSLAIYGMEPGLARQTSLPALERARALTPDLPELWAATAYEAMFLGWEWQTAEQALDRALAGNRHAPEFHCWRGFLLGHLGRFDAAIAVARTAVELDPLSGYARGVLGYLLTGAERDDEAVAVLEEAREMDADFIFTQFLLGIAYAAAGRHEQGATVLERATAQSGRSSFYLGLLGWTYGLADRREDAERLLEELAARRIAGYVPPFCDAWVHCGLGNTDRAFEWLDRSVAAHAFLQPLFPTYRAIGDDPRFDNIKKRMGLA